MKVILLALLYLLCSLNSSSQNVFDYYVSNGGSDTSAGNSVYRPKKTIAGVASAVATGALSGRSLRVGFKSGDVFHETFAPGFPVEAGSYFNEGTGKTFAIFNGTSKFDTGWIKTDSTNNLFEQNINLTGFTGYGINYIGQYSFVSVLEIDRLLEYTSPFTARRVLKFCNSRSLADLTPGSFYEPITAEVNPFRIYIHTSDGSSPNNNPRYRYEVTVRDRAFNSTYQKGNLYERMWIRGYGAGNGMIAAGANSVFNRMILGPAAGIHHLGLRGASVNNSLFLPSAANTSSFALVFYDAEGFGRHNSIKNSIFLDLRSPIYSHTSYGTSYGALELDNVIAFVDSIGSQSFMEVSNTDSAILNNVYAYGFNNGYNYGHTAYFFAKNSSFVDVVNGISFGVENQLATVNNCFVKTRGTSRNNGVIMGSNSKVNLSNSIIHLRNYSRSAPASYAGVFVEGAAGSNNRIEAAGNIFIADVDPVKSVLAASGNSTGGSNWQNNVYILLRGNKIEWKVSKDNTPGSPQETVSFEEWQRRSGKDTKSLFFDLRKDPRGLKAIFADPENGDYSLAKTIEANRIRELRAGMVNPVNCFLKKPSYEDAAKIIMNDGVLAANVCRSPCVQNSIRISHQLNGSAEGSGRVQLNWNIAEEQGIARYEILRSFGNNDFTTIGYKTPTGAGSYSFTDSLLQAGITYNYSLVVVAQSAEKCFSEVRSVKMPDGRPVHIYPNPSTGMVTLSLNSYTGPVNVTATNVLGVKVSEKKLESIYGVPIKLNLSALSKGVYWIKIEAGNQRFSSKIIIR